MFSPLAFTKTYSMAIAAGLGITLVPVLMGYFIRGRIPDEGANPLNRWLIALYRPVLNLALTWPWATLGLSLALLIITLFPLSRLGSEFMPPLDEGDLLYMPSTLPGISAREAARLLQQTNRLIKTVPEVETVFGKAGRHRYRSGAADHAGNNDQFQTQRSVAPGNDHGKTGARTG